jgi:hypothetical protein
MTTVGTVEPCILSSDILPLVILCNDGVSTTDVHIYIYTELEMEI